MFYLFLFVYIFFKNNNFRGKVLQITTNFDKRRFSFQALPGSGAIFDVVFLKLLDSEELLVRVILGSFYLDENLTAIGVCAMCNVWSEWYKIWILIIKLRNLKQREPKRKLRYQIGEHLTNKGKINLQMQVPG